MGVSHPLQDAESPRGANQETQQRYPPASQDHLQHQTTRDHDSSSPGSSNDHITPEIKITGTTKPPELPPLPPREPELEKYNPHRRLGLIVEHDQIVLLPLPGSNHFSPGLVDYACKLPHDTAFRNDVDALRVKLDGSVELVSCEYELRTDYLRIEHTSSASLCRETSVLTKLMGYPATIQPKTSKISLLDGRRPIKFLVSLV
jgi:hypothetical protein